MTESNEKLDQEEKDSHYVIDYKDELSTNLSRIRNKRESNAQTNAWGLKFMTTDPSYDGPRPSAPKPGDLEEDEEEGRPGSSSDPRHATERRGQNKVGPDGEKLRGQTTLDGFLGRTLKATVVGTTSAALKATVAGTTSAALKAASYSGTGALKLFDYATDADGSRERARIERDAEAEAEALRKRTSILAALDEQGERNAARWAAHEDKYAIKRPTGYPVPLNEGDPAHTKQTWVRIGSMGADLLATGERYMLNNPGNTYLEGAGPVRKGKKKK
jgi:hypothetical protein